MKISDYTSSFPVSLRAGLSLLLPAFWCVTAAAADGTWKSIDASNTYSDLTNWVGEVDLADGTDATANLVYGPSRNISGSTADVGSNIVLDTADRKLGHIVMEDIDEYGSASLALTFSGTINPITMETTTGVPDILVGQNLNSAVNGKKAIIAARIEGAQGLRKTGPGFLGIRAGNATSLTQPFTGDFLLEGGVAEMSADFLYTGKTAVRGGSTLSPNFGNTNTPLTDIIDPASVLELGSSGTGGATRGGGVVVNGLRAAPSDQFQTFNNVVLNEGVHEIRAATASPTAGAQNMTYTLGTITRNAGSTLNFSKPTAAGTGTFNVTAVNGSDGILGAWATCQLSTGTEWAAESGGTVVQFPTAAYLADIWQSGTDHTSLVSSQTLNGATAHTLRSNQGYCPTITLAGVNTIETGGILVNQSAPLFTGGTLTSGTAEMLLHSFSGSVIGPRIASTIADGTAGSVRLIKAGTGQATIEGTMTYTGGTYIGGGNMLLGNGFGGGSTGSVSGDIFVNSYNVASGAFTPSGALLLNRSGTYTLANNVSGPGAIGQISTGTLVIGRATPVRGLQALAGTTRLDFSAPGAPATEMINSAMTAGTGKLDGTSLLTIRSATLDIVGSGFIPQSQSFGVTFTGGAGRITASAVTEGSMTVNLGALGRFNNSNDGGGTLQLTGGPGVTFTAPANQSPNGTNVADRLVVDLGIPYMTVGGSDWAARDSTKRNLVPGSSIGGFYTPSSTALSGNVDMNSSATASGATVLSSLRFNEAAAHTLTVDTGATLEPRGILVTPAVGANVSTIGGTGGLRCAATGNAATVSRDLVIIQNNPSAPLVITAPVVNIDVNTRTALVKSGAGEVVLTNSASTYTDRTFVNEGALTLTGTTTIGTTAARSGSIFIRGGGTLTMKDSANAALGAFLSAGQRAGEEGTLVMQDNALLDTNADFNVGDVNSKGTLTMSGNARVVSPRLWAGKGGFSEGTVNLSGSAAFVAGNTPNQDWRFGGNGSGDPSSKGFLTLADNALLDSAAQNFQLGAHGFGRATQTGGTYRSVGFSVLGRFHSGVGEWNISGGSLDVTGSTVSAVAAKDYLIIGEQGIGTLNASGGTVRARSISLSHNGGVGVLNISGTAVVDLNGTATLANAIQPGIVFSPGAIAPALSVPGGPAGTVNLNGGTLKAFSLSERSGATVTSTVNFNGGTLEAIGANPVFLSGLDAANVQAGGAVIDTAGFDINIDQTLDHDTALGATADGGLTKKGAGTLTLSTGGSLTGPVVVQGGTVALNSGNLSASSGTTVETSAMLSGTGTVGGNSTIRGAHSPGASPGIQPFTGSLNYAATAQLNWELTENAATGAGIAFDQVQVNGPLSVTAGAKINVSLNGAGSTVDFSNAFWSASRAWVIGTASGITGTFSIGTVSTDSLGNPAPATGSFSTRVTGTNLELVWTVGALTPFQTWQQAKFGTNAGNPAIAGADADPDGDGLKNLAEYALAAEPKAHTVCPTPPAASGRSITWTKNLAATDVTVTVKASTDLATWSAAGITTVSAGVAGGVETFVSSYPAGADVKKFLRIEVTKP